MGFYIYGVIFCVFRMQFGQALSDKLFDEPLPLSDITVKNGSLAVTGEERRCVMLYNLYFIFSFTWQTMCHCFKN